MLGCFWAAEKLSGGPGAEILVAASWTGSNSEMQEIDATAQGQFLHLPKLSG